MTRERTRPRLRLWVVAGVIAAAVGYLLFQGLDEATVYFYRADEAVARREELGERRFRLQGTVVDDSVRQAGGEVDFDVAAEGATVAVRHAGDPPDLFRPGLPVVLEGRWDGDRFASDRIMVKHSEEYRADNPDRVPRSAP